MQFVVKGMAILMQKVMGISGAESLNVAASIFMGQTKRPHIKPSRGPHGIRTLYHHDQRHGARFRLRNGRIRHGRARLHHHLLTAVIMTAPATSCWPRFSFRKPKSRPPRASGNQSGEDRGQRHRRSGARRGRRPATALNVGGMLIAFLALIAMLNGILAGPHSAADGLAPGLVGTDLWNRLFASCWIMGVPWKDCLTIGNLLGTRLVTNEFVAFVKLGDPAMRASLDPKSFVIATYALCGFANLSSIAIQIGGIGSLAPPASLTWRGSACGRDGGHDGEFHVGLHCGNVIVTEAARRQLRAARRCGRPWEWC